MTQQERKETLPCLILYADKFLLPNYLVVEIDWHLAAAPQLCDTSAAVS
jgi:hypothetical protein